MKLGKLIVLFALLGVCFGPPVLSQQLKKPLSLKDIGDLLRNQVTPGHVATLVDVSGVDFDLTGENLERLKRLGADATVIEAVKKSQAKSAFSQEQRILSLEDIEELLTSGVGQIRIAELISKHGIDFGLTDEVGARLKKLGAGVRVIEAVEKVGKKKSVSKDGTEMVLVPAGEFWMGSEDGDSDEKPRRRVYLDAFSIDKYEVTNELYRRFMEATGRAAPAYWGKSNFNALDQPVVGVSWHDAEAYCRWNGKRLPTEAEWEKAARGTEGWRYPWGDQWISNLANSEQGKLGKTSPVGSYTGRSRYGVHDMAGNVWEWVADWYDSSYYLRSPDRNPKGPDSGQYRVLRGGSWLDVARDLRSSNRFRDVPSFRDNVSGFRCAQ